MTEKNRKKFSDLFKDSLKEYKSVWKVFLIIMIFLSFIPSIILSIFQYLFDLNISRLGVSSDPSPALTIFMKFYTPVIVIGLILFILGIWMNSSFIYNSIYKKKVMGIKETLNGGKKYFWKFLGLALLIGLIFFVPVFILGMIGGSLFIFNVPDIYMVIYVIVFILFILFIIWFSIYWLFSSYVLIAEDKKIIESMKLSKKLVNGKWWKTFGYMVLFFLVLVFVGFVIFSLSGLINLGINPDYLNPAVDIDTPAYRINIIVSLIFSFINASLMAPFGILFLKNFYLLRKSE